MNKIVILAAGFAIAGCGPSPKPRRLIIAIDVSEPERLLTYARIAYEMESRLKVPDRLTVYVFGHDCDLVYDGPPVRGRNAFNQAISRELRMARAALRSRGTRTDLALACEAADAKTSGMPVDLAIETDGGVEDLSPAVRQHLSASVGTIKGSRQIQKLVAIGVEPQWRRQWSAWLAPLGGRSLVCGTNDYGAALQALRAGVLR